MNKPLIARSNGLAFSHYLRTGRWPTVEVKFNPYHDPRNGRFTFAPGGPKTSVPKALRSPHKLRLAAKSPVRTRSQFGSPSFDAPQQTQGGDNYYRVSRTNPRARIGGNSRNPVYDPMTLHQVFPRLQKMPGGSVIAIADNVFDLTGPATRMSSDMALNYTNLLIGQIRAIDPAYRFESLGFPQTVVGQFGLINELRLDRAEAFFRVKSELRPLQVETMRFLQNRVDTAFERGEALFKAGRLKPRLSRNEAIGNFVDGAVRDQLRELYNSLGIPIERGQTVQVNRRASNSADGSYSIPDSKVGNIAFDVTMTQKSLKTTQIQHFFASDFQPTAVVIIRPRQLGPNSSYIILKPKGQ